MSDCIFCKIIEGEIPSKKVYEDQEILAFYDVNPQAPVHVVVVPKKHIKSVAELQEEDLGVVGRIFGVMKRIASELNLQNGYRIVNNCGEDGQQSVPHLHFHLLGGRKMTWPPG